MSNYSSITDYELTIFFKDGDLAAYTEIYKRYTGILYGHAFSKLQDREEARDVVQELFTTVWAGREDMPLTENLAGYLFKALRNKILNLISHKKIESEYITSLQGFMNKGEAITDYLIREHELTALIEREIAGLPPKMRAVFELSRKANLSHKEIATQLNISEKTVKNQVNNSLKLLRAKLGLLIYLVFLLNN